ncbi:PIN domain-containing protein [Thermodesulfovibrionales bacterium]|nr:PIN domain-containing protein [Thermodesulfovibrionales bacterium]
MYLLDSNIFLELLLDQDGADEVEMLLRSVPRERLHLSEFSFYSVGIVLFRHKLFNVFVHFANDILVTGGIRLLRIAAEDASELSKVAQRFNLDFDDSYQYLVADRYRLTIVSFDSDFDRTKRGRKTPKDLME